MARMGVSVMPPGFFTQLEGLKLRILVLTLILQIYLMIELKKLVTSVAVAEIRDLYDRYQVVMPPGHESFLLGLHLGTAMTPAEWLSPPLGSRILPAKRRSFEANGYHRGREPFFNAKNFELLDECFGSKGRGYVT